MEPAEERELLLRAAVRAGTRAAAEGLPLAQAANADPKPQQQGRGNQNEMDDGDQQRQRRPGEPHAEGGASPLQPVQGLEDTDFDESGTGLGTGAAKRQFEGPGFHAGLYGCQ